MDDETLAHGEPLTDLRVYISLWLLEVCAAMADASVGNGLLGLLFWAALFAGTLVLGADYARRPGDAKRKRGEYVAAAGMIAFVFTLITGDALASALVVMVMWLLAALNATLATRRYGYFALAVSFVVMLFAAAQSKSGWFLFIGIGYALACMYTLLLLHAEGIRSHAAGVAAEQRWRLPASVLPLTGAVLAVAALLYLFMPRPPALLYGQQLKDGGVNYRNRAWEKQAKQQNDDSEIADSENGGMGRANSPDTTGSGDNGSGNNVSNYKGSGGASNGSAGNGSSSNSDDSDNPSSSAGASDDGQTKSNHNNDFAGFSDRYDLNGSPGLYPGIVLYVQASQPLYLQERVFDTFDGLSWHASRHHIVKHLLKYGSYQFDGRTDGTLVHQVITVVHTLPPLLPAASLVTKLRFPGTVFGVDPYGGLRLPRRLAKGTHYEVFSRREYVAGHPYMPATPDNLKPYLQLPPQLDPRIGDLAKQVTAGSKNNLHAAVALEHYLRSHYHYTFATVFKQNHIPLAGFLFDTRRGHCEYFATAMTIMLRTRGIPARLVSGFSADNYNPLTGYYEVRGIDGHAWTEAYLQQYGWVTFDATPFYDLPQPQSPGTTAKALNNYVQKLKRIAQQTNPHAGTTSVLSGIAALFSMIGQAVSHLMSLIHAALVAAGPALLVIVVILGFVGWGLYTLRQPLRDRLGALQVARAKPAEIAWIGYREMEGWFARHGDGRAPGETVEAYAHRLGSAHPETAKEIAHITTLFVRQRYGEIALEADAVKTIRTSFSAITSHGEQQKGRRGKDVGAGK